MSTTLTVEQLEAMFKAEPVAVVEAPRLARRLVVLPLGSFPRLALVEDGRCCADAERVACVCRVCWRCAKHGERHLGTHD